MGNRMRCSLLCEDVEQERFFRPILERVFGTRVNVEARKPAGGAPFVMAQLPRLVKGIRQRHQESMRSMGTWHGLAWKGFATWIRLPSAFLAETLKLGVFGSAMFGP